MPQPTHRRAECACRISSAHRDEQYDFALRPQADDRPEDVDVLVIAAKQSLGIGSVTPACSLCGPNKNEHANGRDALQFIPCTKADPGDATARQKQSSLLSSSTLRSARRRRFSELPASTLPPVIEVEKTPAIQVRSGRKNEGFQLDDSMLGEP